MANLPDLPVRLTTALADRYRIERELGQGGMATVYLAHDLRHDRRVAVKVLRPELAAVIGAERFLAEIKTTANLQHPHILALFDSGQVESTVFYVMPFVEGESLRDRLVREKQLPVADAVRIATEAASALDYAHRHHVVHRDIKPENILLHDGSALVADFGIALAVSRSDGGSRMTETGMSLGTPHYMSPEQAMGEREITPRSDVYALGCVLYEMLAGEPPFTGPTAQAIVARVMTEEPRSLTMQRKSIPPHVAAAVRAALEKLPADRFASAAQFAEALANPNYAATAPAPGHRTTAASVSPLGRPAILIPWIIAALGLAVAAWSWLRGRPAEALPIARHYISLGDSVRLQTGVPGTIAISPDGSRLAFVDDSLRRLWVKRRDELNPTLLTGTDGASNPEFSPDGQWLAYIVGQQLRKVRADGGASVMVADSVAGPFGGAAWLDDGTLVYVPASLQGFRRISANGGQQIVAMSDTGLIGLGLGAPTPLPDSRGVIFIACSSGCGQMSLHVLDLKSGVQRLLFNDVAKGWYLPTGQLLYVRRDGVALVAPFDLAKLEVNGQSVPVLEGVAQNATRVQLAWSPTGTLVYTVGGVSSDIVTFHRINKNGSTTPVDSTWEGQFYSFALSPDESRLAVGAITPGAGLNIWIKQLDRGPFTRFTFGGRDRRPTWSPDGRRVAFVRDTVSGGDVYVRAVEGSGSERRMAHLDRAIQEVTWSADGHWILVRTDNSQAGGGDILAIRTDGDSTPVGVAVSPFTELHPALSPDCHWLAYSSNESGIYEVYVRPFPNADAGRWQVSNGGGSEPRWSADGRTLYFQDGNSRLTAAQIRTGPTFAVPVLQSLFDASGYPDEVYHQAFEVMRDGRFLFLGPLHAVQQRLSLVQVDNWFADLRARVGR